MNQVTHFSVYDEDYFRALESSSRASAEVIVPRIIEKWSPRSVVDVGCGEGVWGNVLADAGTDVLGVDGYHLQQERLQIRAFVACDLSKSVPRLGTFDLVICVEVAEHLPSRSAERFVTDLVNLGPRIVFSAATPGQGGTLHMNEQPHDYWISLFAGHDYSADLEFRRCFAKCEDVASWYRKNIVVFERRDPGQ